MKVNLHSLWLSQERTGKLIDKEHHLIIYKLPCTMACWNPFVGHSGGKSRNRAHLLILSQRMEHSISKNINSILQGLGVIGGHVPWLGQIDNLVTCNNNRTWTQETSILFLVPPNMSCGTLSQVMWFVFSPVKWSKCYCLSVELLTLFKLYTCSVSWLYNTLWFILTMAPKLFIF